MLDSLLISGRAGAVCVAGHHFMASNKLPFYNYMAVVHDSTSVSTRTTGTATARNGGKEEGQGGGGGGGGIGGGGADSEPGEQQHAPVLGSESVGLMDGGIAISPQHRSILHAKEQCQSFLKAQSVLLSYACVRMHACLCIYMYVVRVHIYICM